MDEDPFDAIARKKGWLPLSEGEAMTVSFGKRRYHVKRLTDQWPCDVPTGQLPLAKNLVSFPPFGWRIVDTTLELTFQNRDEVVFSLGQLMELRRTPVKAVAVDTNEERETASQAHTGTKD